MASPLSLAIVGAGPAGLSLARLLQVSAAEENVSLQVTIFEKDASPTSRTFQGGSLDLHPPTGLAAIKAMKLWDEFLKHARYEGEELVFADKNGTEFIHMHEAAQIEGFESRPEIDREELKNLLLRSVPPECIQWGKNLRSVTDAGTLNFSDDTTAGPFDLIIGAEGAWSKVAQIMTDVRPKYSNISGIECSVPKPNEDLSKLVGRGSYFAYSDSKSITAQRMGDESLKVGAWMRRDENYTAKLMAEAGSNEEKLKEMILEHYKDWLPEIRKCVEVSTRLRPRSLYELPVDHRWVHKEGYTLIGDSAHLMTPFAGEGVNTALKDALELAGAIIASQKTQVALDTVVRLFEEQLFARMNLVQRETMRNKNAMFRSDAPVGLMLAFVDTFAEKTSRNLNEGIWRFIPVKGLVRCYFVALSMLGRLRRRFRSLWTRY